MWVVSFVDKNWNFPRSLPDDEAEPQPSTSTQSVEKREGRSIHQRTVDILREMTAENVDDSVAQLREIDLHSYQNLKRFVSAVHDMVSPQIVY